MIVLIDFGLDVDIMTLRYVLLAFSLHSLIAWTRVILASQFHRTVLDNAFHAVSRVYMDGYL